jgi:integrase/recombinase XerD
MIETLTLEEIAQDLRVSPRSVRRIAKSGNLPVISKPFKGGFRYIVPLQSYLDWKKDKYNRKCNINYLGDLTFLKEKQKEWTEWCSKGLLTGKPLCETTVKLYNDFLNYYFEHIPRRYYKSPVISLETLRDVFSSIDPKSYSIKKNIYDAIRSFIKFLITNNYAEASLLTDIKQIRPKRLYPPRKPHCTKNEFEKLLQEANKRHSGQSEYDVILNSATIATIVFSGLRASELCNLRLQDVDLVNKKLFVYLGKGKKNRSIGICNRLYDYLIKYLEVRPKSDNNNLFLTISNLSGEPVSLTRETLLQKVKRLSKRIGLDINLHGLRRTFATVAANAGKPINIISLALGHSDLKTTQGYLMTSQDEVIKEMQGW